LPPSKRPLVRKSIAARQFQVPSPTFHAPAAGRCKGQDHTRSLRLAKNLLEQELQRQLHLPRKVQLILANAAISIARARAPGGSSVRPGCDRVIGICRARASKDWGIRYVEGLSLELHFQPLHKSELLRHGQRQLRRPRRPNRTDSRHHR